MGPPLIGPSWRSPKLRRTSSRSGTCDGFWSRHTFHALGPWRKISLCSESAKEVYRHDVLRKVCNIADRLHRNELS
jgi:hypothetical protein